MWHPDPFLKEMVENQVPKYSFSAKNKSEWEQWRRDLHSTFIEDLGGFPKEHVDLNAQVIEEQEMNNYIRQRVEYSTYPNLRVPAYLLLPKHKKGRKPAIIACHGHGYGSKDIVGLHPDGSERTGDPGYHKDFAIELVKRGFVVIAPEILGFGDRKLEADRHRSAAENSCYPISTQLLMMGKTIAGVRVYETMRALDYLAMSEEVDADRIGCMGISGGGLVGSFTAAIDERVKVAVISGYTNTFKESVMSIIHCIDNFIPGIMRHAEMHDLIGLIAPRPLLIESGTNDPIFPIRATEKAYSKIKEIYDLLGQRDKLEKDIFEGAHEIHGKKAYDWLERWL